MVSQKSIKEIVKLDSANYQLFGDMLANLYLHAFTTGDYAQYMTADEAQSVLDKLAEAGKGLIWLNDNQPAALIFTTALNYDSEFPAETMPHLNRDECAYIAEVIVHSDFRGKGIATRLIETALDDASDKFSNVVIRVWDRNKPAVSLYNKMGFSEFASIIQTKKHSQDNFFDMRKIYMIKELK